MAWLAVFFLAFILRLANVLFLADTPLYQALHGDGRVYIQWADAIRAGGTSGVFNEGEVFYQAPLYPHVLAAFRAIFGESLVAIRMGQAVLGACTAVLIGVTTARLLDRRSGVVAGILVAIYAPSIWLDGLVQKSALAAFLFAATMLLATWADRRGRFSLGIVVGLLMLTRGEARLVALAIGGWLYFRLAATPRIDRLLAYALGLAVVLTPVLMRNGLVGGEWVLTTSQSGPNLYIGNAVGSSGTYAPLVPGHGDARSEADDARSLAEADVGRELSSRDVSSYWRTRAIGDMVADPVAAVERLGYKGLLALNATEIPDSDDLGHAASTSPILRFGPGFAVLLVLAALGAVLARRDERRSLRLSFVLAATQWAALVLFFVFARYRLPLALAIAPAAGLAIAHIVRVRERRIVSLLAVAGALVLAFLPLDTANPAAGRAVALVNEGNVLVEIGRFADARVCAEEAVGLAPELFDAHRLLALTLLRDDASAAALSPLERAHELAPDDWQVRAWLGVALGETGERRRAYAFLLGAASERPETLPIVSYAVGLALEFGEQRSAIALLRARLEAEPSEGARPFRLRLGWILATSKEDSLRSADEALRVLEPLADARDVLDVRAAALAEAGRYGEAVETIDRALAAEGARAAVLRRRRAAYESQRPWRD